MAKAKSASPSWRASVSRIRQSVRTSSGCRRVGIGRGVREPAVAAELLHELAAGGIDVAVIDRQVRRAPALDGLPASARWRSSKNGQLRKLLSATQLPSNTGFCLATNAR